MWMNSDTRELWRRFNKLENKLNDLSRKLDLIINQENEELATLADLQAQVAKTQDTEDSAVALITGLVAKIQELINSGASPEQFQALVDDLKAHTDPLAAAVVNSQT